MSTTDREMFKDQVFLEMSLTLGSLGTCSRAQVGAIITTHGRAVSWGYNGAPPGLPHCSENMHGYVHGWKHYELDYPTKEEWMAFIDSNGCKNATHAEQNALAFAARQGISTDDGTLYVERSPCEACARLCIAAGIARVVFRVAYRDATGINLLRSAGVNIECLT